MRFADDLKIDDDFYDTHENEFFIIFNSMKKDDEETNFSEADKDYRIFFDNIRSGQGGRESNFAKFFKNEIIEKLWNADGAWIGFGKSQEFKRYCEEDLKH